MVAPYFTTRQQVAVKIETTEGTDSVPANIDVVAPVYDIEWTPNFEVFERDIQQSSYSRPAQIVGERSATIAFATELKGSGVAGTVPPNLSAVFRSCSFAETIVPATSVTYALASESLESATVEVREVSQDGTTKSRKIVGARGTLTIEATKGQPVLVRVEYTGRYIEPTETVAFATPSIGPLPQPFLNVGFSFHGVGSLKIEALTIDIANGVELRNDANQQSGNFSAAIVSRRSVGNIDPELEDIATINFFNKLTTNAEGALTYALSGGAGNITTITCPKAQLVNISPADRNSIRTEGIDLQFNQDTNSGDDEISIVFT